MNRFKKASWVIALVAGMVFASGSIWRVGVPYGIAQFDWIKQCLASGDFDETDSDDPCYKQHGGWLFGYVYGASSGDPNPPCDVYRNEGYKSGINYVKAKISDQWVSFAGNDYDDCIGPPFTNKEEAGAWLIDKGLETELNIGPGVDATYTQAGAAIGLNFSQPPIPGKVAPIDRNFASKGGFCMTYEVSFPDGKPATFKEKDFVLALGWNDDDASQVDEAHKIPYDGWFHPIPTDEGMQVKDFLWTGGAKGTGGFMQEGWATGAWSLEKATTEMRNIAIKLVKNATPYTPIGPVKFTLYQLGWPGECDTKVCDRDDKECQGTDGGGSTPVISRGPALANISFKQVGRTFSLAKPVEKPVAVQVINLQGAIVHSQTMSANSIMNLSNLPTGVYMLRTPALGYTSKVILK